MDNNIDITEGKKDQLLRINFLRIILYSALLGINYYFRNDKIDAIAIPAQWTIYILLLVYSLSITYAIIIIRHNFNVKKMVAIQTILDVAIASFVILLTGSSYSSFTSILFFPIVSGGLLLPGRLSLFPAAIATFAFALLMGNEYYQIAPGSYVDISHSKNDNLLYLLDYFARQGLTFFLAGVICMLGAIRLQNTELALFSSEKKYGALAVLYKRVFDNISTAIISIDQNFTITSVNNEALKILEQKKKEIIGKKIHKIMPILNIKEINQRQSFKLEVQGKTKLIGLSHSYMPKQVMKNSDEKSLDHIITFRDITEYQRLSEVAKQNEKLATIGTMSASIAHDFRNPLAAISGSTQILLAESTKESIPADTYQLYELIDRESKRLLDKISGFLTLSRNTHTSYDWFSVKRCIDETTAMCEVMPHWRKSCQIKTEISRNLDMFADKDQISTILNHLLENAILSCAKGKEIIKITAHEITIKDNDFIRISVADNGSGVSETNLENIFEPFYTTRMEGTGLGLSIIKQFSYNHDAQVCYKKSEFGGAEFVIDFPFPEE
ncbi:MAG: ATP-binding protein [Desulfotalea sp.]